MKSVMYTFIKKMISSKNILKRNINNTDYVHQCPYEKKRVIEEIICEV